MSELQRKEGPRLSPRAAAAAAADDDDDGADGTPDGVDGAPDSADDADGSGGGAEADTEAAGGGAQGVACRSSPGGPEEVAAMPGGCGLPRSQLLPTPPCERWWTHTGIVSVGPGPRLLCAQRESMAAGCWWGLVRVGEGGGGSDVRPWCRARRPSELVRLCRSCCCCCRCCQCGPWPGTPCADDVARRVAKGAECLATGAWGAGGSGPSLKAGGWEPATTLDSVRSSTLLPGG